MALIQSMSLRGKLTLAACGVAFLIAVIVILRIATAPSYVTVMTGVDATKSAEITAALASSGIEGELVNGGTELQVPKGKEDKAVTALASAGLNTSKTRQTGFSETLDKQKLGASNMQQKIAYQRGLEGEIAQAISKIDGVGEANVRLTLPDDSAFVGVENEGQSGATAAVVLGSTSTMLNPGAVRGIANVVASSVPKLNPQKVTITDAAGTLLWPTGDGSGNSDGASSKAAAEAMRAQATEARLNALLDQTLGSGRGRVQVTYDLDMDKVSKEQLAYDEEGTPSHVESKDERMTGRGARAGGTAGVNTNVPTYNGANGGNGGNTNYNQRDRKTDMAVGKTITKTEVASGAVKAMQVGLIVDKGLGLTPPQLESLQKMVGTAAGVQEGRDSITATELAFPKVEQPKGSPLSPSTMNIVKVAALGLGVLLFLFFLGRYLRRREGAELIDEPSWLRQLPQPPEPEIVLPEIEQPQPVVAAANLEALRPADPRRLALEEIVDHEPERVAAQLRNWISEDGHQ